MSEKIETNPAYEKREHAEDAENADDFESPEIAEHTDDFESAKDAEHAKKTENADDFERADKFEHADDFGDFESSEDEPQDEPETFEADSQAANAPDEGLDGLESLDEQQDPGDETEDGTSAGPAPASAEPLLASASAGGFLDRWSDVQAGFIEDPHRSVSEADTLLTEVVAAFQEAVEQRRAQIGAVLADGTADTEDLRLALLAYRAAITTMLPSPDGGQESATTAPVSNW